MTRVFRTALLTLSVAFAASAARVADGWEDVNPERREFPPQKVLWRANLSAAKLDCRDGAEGTLRVIEEKGVTKLEIVKKNDRGTLVVTVPPFAAAAGAKLRACAFCECADGDSEYGTACLRLYGKKEDLTYFKGLDIRRPGGPRMEKMVNSAPGTRIRKLAHRIADAKTGTNLTAAIVVAGPPSTSRWSDWGVEDFDASIRAWNDLLKTKTAPDLSSDMLDERTFAARLAAEPDHTAKVVRRDGWTRLLVDGVETPPVIFRGHYSPDGRNTFAGGPLGRAGIDLQGITVRFGQATRPRLKKGIWTKDGFDAKAGAAIVRGAMRLAPEAKFIVSMNLSIYTGYGEEHPDEIWLTKEGRKVFGGSEHIPNPLPKEMDKDRWLWVSMFSPSWQADTARNIAALIAELKAQGLAKRIVGFHFSGFHDGQFAMRQADFSPCAVAAFRDWQKAEYGEVRWADAPRDFGDAEFLDPAKDAHRLAYVRFLKQGPFRVLERFARVAKSSFGKDVVALRYCMSWGAAALNGALDIGPFLASDVFDALVAQPSYTHRIPGVAIGSRIPTASFHEHGKLFINEFDLRTYGGTHQREDELFTCGLSKAIDFPMWETIHHKLAGQMFAQRMGWWYCDMSGAWFSPPEIVRDIGGVRACATRAETANGWHPSAAVVIDEDGMLERNFIAHYYALPEYAVQNQQRVLAGSGVPYETFVLNDFLANSSLADRYKYLLFADVWRVDEKRRALFDALKAKGVCTRFVDPAREMRPEEFAADVRAAGGYVPTRQGLEVDMNGAFVSLHCLKPGHYDFTLPRPCAVRNLKTGASVPVTDGRIALDLTAGETRWYGLDDLQDAPRKDSSVSARYGFTFFRNNGEDGVFLATSSDGRNWRERDGVILKGCVGGGLTRDPSVVFGPDGLYHMVWTTDWNTNGFGLAHSPDLRSWSVQEFVPVMAHRKDVGNVWAPEIFYDKSTASYGVVWASTTGEPARQGRRDHRQWIATTRDFKTWTKAAVFFDPGFNVIDAFPVRFGDEPLLIVKDERVDRKCLFVVRSMHRNAMGPYEQLGAPFCGLSVEGGALLVEGPTALELPEGEWMIYFDEYRRHGYGAMSTRDFKTFVRRTDFSLPKGIRHGTAFKLGARDPVAASVASTVRLGAPFGDGMVLQRARPVPVWGWAEPGERVTVAFAGQEKTATTGADGRWRVDLGAMPASKESRTLTVTSNLQSSIFNLKDVLVGEVYLASGQSNMDFRFVNYGNPRTRERNGALLAQLTSRPTIRYACVARVTADAPCETVKVDWHAFTPQFLMQSGPSAVATYFALDLESALLVPVGIIGCAWGGTNIDAWIPHDAESAKTAHKPRRPSCRPGVIYNGRIAPLAPFAFRGILWYQGEADSDEPEKYAWRMAQLRAGWNRVFENPDAPFLFVQLAPYDYSKSSTPRDFVRLQLEQATYAATATNAWMAIVNDAGNIHDIHPNDKRPVGLRLAALALRHVHGFESVEADAPRAVKATRREDGRVALAFENGKGLYVYNEDKSLVIGLELAGADGVYHPAKIANVEKTGKIAGTPLVESPEVSDPKYVRYLFNKPWYGALRNANSLPVGPFRLAVEPIEEAQPSGKDEK